MSNRIAKYLDGPKYTHGYSCECDACANCEPPIHVRIDSAGVRVVEPDEIREVRYSFWFVLGVRA